jgi:hypothetical protein
MEGGDLPQVSVPASSLLLLAVAVPVALAAIASVRRGCFREGRSLPC